MRQFRSFLVGECHVPHKKVPYFLSWISKYHAFIKSSTQNESECIESFLKALSGKYQNWQVEQAEKAIALFLRFEKSGMDDSDIQQPSQIPSNWKTVEQELVRYLRLKHRSYRTEKTYLGWVRRFSKYLHYKNPNDVIQADLSGYLSFLAVEKKVSASTQNQAFNALLFVFRNVLGTEIKGLEGTVRSCIRRRLPVVLTRQEIKKIFSRMPGVHRLMAGIIYRGGRTAPARVSYAPSQRLRF